MTDDLPLVPGGGWWVMMTHGKAGKCVIIIAAAFSIGFVFPWYIPFLLPFNINIYILM